MRKIRNILMTALALVLAFSMFTPAGLYADEIRVTVDGVTIDFEGQSPIIVDGRTLVPIRGVFEHLGFDVDFDNSTRTAFLVGSQDSLYSNYEFRVPIGSSYFELNGQSFQLDVPAQIINGRTMLPIRPLLEQIGFGVDWDSDTRTVIIKSLMSPLFGMTHEQITDGLVGTWAALESNMPGGHHFSSFTLNTSSNGMGGDGEVVVDANIQRIYWLVNAYGDLVIFFTDNREEPLNYYKIAELTTDNLTLLHSTFEMYAEGLAPYKVIFTREQ